MLKSGTQLRLGLCPLPAGSGQPQGHAVALQPLQRRAGLRQPRSRPARSSRMAPRAQASGEPSVRQEETVALPLDYYKLLGVSPVCSRDNLAKALEKALLSPPSVGYSQQCLLGRGSALKRAVETLLDTQSRKAYDDALRMGAITENVPDEFVPGVLALLLEAGEAQTAVAAGEEWLSTHRRDTRARDVALTTALAHRSVAEMHARKQGDALTAAGMLEVACELLKRHRAAPQLQQEVAGALAELQPALACQLVALPLERFQERERGVKVAISVLTDTTGAKRGMGKQQFLDHLADSLTASEQVEVFEAAGRAYAELPCELYGVALAYIAEAAHSGKPAALDRALGALQAAAAAVPPGATGQASDSGVRQLAERRAIEERNRRQVAYAVCQLLLGETEEAADTLGLLPGSDTKCERTMLAFVKANSPDPEDLLPGLCVLGQRWVADVALASFRGTQGVAFSLEGWFEAEAVRRGLWRRQAGGTAATRALAGARQAAVAASVPLVKGLASVLDFMNLLDTPDRQLKQQRAAAAAERAEEEAALDAAADALLAKMDAAVGAAPEATAAQEEAPAAVQRMPTGQSLAEAIQAAAARDMAEVDMRSSRQARPQPKPRAAAGEPVGELKPRHTARPGITAAALNARFPAPTAPVEMPAPLPEAAAGEEAFDANLTFAMQPVDQLTVLAGEQRMWDSSEPRSVRWGRLAATVALLAGGSFLLGRAALLQRPAPAGQALPTVAVQAATQVAAAPALSRSEAANIISKWQAVKARALGPQHDARGLASILRGEVLQQWQERAQQIQSKGWHYLHTLEGSQINTIRPDAATGAVSVSATFREAVEAHRGSGEPVQAFRSEYSVDYELMREGNSWVITGAVVRY